MVERILGKDEVTGSIPVNSSTKRNKLLLVPFFCFNFLLALFLLFAKGVCFARKGAG